MIKKIILRSLVFLILISGLLFAYPKIMSFFVRDISEFDVSDLNLKKPNLIPEDQNIYFLLKKIIEKNPDFYLKTNKTYFYIPEYADDKEKSDIESLLSDYSHITENFMKIDGLSLYQNPNLPKNLDDSYDLAKNVQELLNLRSIFYFNNSYALFIASKGKTDQALEILFQHLRVESNILQSDISLIEYLVFVTQKKTDLDNLIGLIPKANWDSEKTQKIITLLSLTTLKKTEQELINTLKIEFLTASSMINFFVAKGLNLEKIDNVIMQEFFGIYKDSLYYFQPNKIKQMYAKFFKKKINEMKIDCKNTEYTSIAPLKPSYFFMYVASNSIGKATFDTYSYSTNTRISNIIKRSCEIESLAQKATDMIKNKQNNSNF